MIQKTKNEIFENLLNGIKKLSIDDNLNIFLHCFKQIEDHLLWEKSNIFSIRDRKNLLSYFNELTKENKVKVLGYRDKLRNSLLMDAIETSSEDFALFMIDLGSDINAFNVNGKSILMLAVKNNLNKVVDELLKRNVDVNYARMKSDLYGEKVGPSALMIAAEYGYFELADKLIKAGADVNYKNDLNQIALMYCVKKTEDHLNCFKLLLELPELNKKIQYDMLGNNVMERVFWFGSFDFIEPMLSHLDFDKDLFDKIKKVAFDESRLVGKSEEKNNSEVVQERIIFAEKFMEAKNLNNSLLKKEVVPNKKFKI